MKPSIVAEAGKIWQQIASDAEVQELQFELEVHRRLLGFFQVGDYYYYIFNIKTSAIEFMSDGVRKLLGYEPNEVDVPFLLNKIHPEDQPWFLSFEQRVGEFFATLSPQQIPNYKVRYDYRIQKADGQYLRVLQQVVTIQHEDAHLLRSFGVHTDISHIKQEGGPVLSFIGMNGEPSFVNVGVAKLLAVGDEIFTPREKEILRLLIEGRDSAGIAGQLHLSKLTVDTHRKNMLRKANCTNTAMLVSAAIKKGWL